MNNQEEDTQEFLDQDGVTLDDQKYDPELNESDEYDLKTCHIV